MQVSCMNACSSPPTSPSGRVSDWDGWMVGTAAPGTVVTYKCYPPVITCPPITSVCDPQSLQWTVSSIPDCDSCTSIGTNSSATFATTSVPVTTTTEEYPATPTTYPNVTCCDNVL